MDQVHCFNDCLNSRFSAGILGPVLNPGPKIPAHILGVLQQFDRDHIIHTKPHVPGDADEFPQQLDHQSLAFPPNSSGGHLLRCLWAKHFATARF